MPTYKEWNEAISIYFTYGFGAGESVYLSIDNDTLEQIGRIITKDTHNSINWTEDFLQAVQTMCIQGDAITFSKIAGTDPRGIPSCVAFLGAMVLAAHQMAYESQDEGVIGEIVFDKNGDLIPNMQFYIVKHGKLQLLQTGK